MPRKLKALEAADFGRVSVVNGERAVCELGLAMRMGLARRVDAATAAEIFPLFALFEEEERPVAGEQLCGRPVFAWVTQLEAAKLVQLSTRQLQNLEVKGLPSKGQGTSKRYALPHLVIWFRWYRAREQPRRLSWKQAEALNDAACARYEAEATE